MNTNLKHAIVISILEIATPLSFGRSSLPTCWVGCHAALLEIGTRITARRCNAIVRSSSGILLDACSAFMRMHSSYNMSYCYPQKNEQERVKTYTRILNFLCYNRNVQWFYVHNFSQKVPLFVNAGSHLNESASFPRSRIRARMGQSGSFQHIKCYNSV